MTFYRVNMISDLQAQVDEWNARQPWANDPPIVVVVGLGEETGEVQRAVLKMYQGIRGTEAEWLAEAKKECGDVFIKLCNLASSLGFDLDDAITDRWAEVSKRDFVKDPQGHGIEKT